LKLASKCAFLALAIASAEVPAFLRDAANIGMPGGAKAPAFKLPDQSGHKRTLASLMGRRGLVLVFFRSADW